MNAIIDVQHLTKRYGDTTAVADVSFAVQPGEIFGILGRNGAGKTTTVECLAGLRRADGGSIRVLGQDPGRDAAALRNQVGIQLQEARLPARLRVGEALNLYAAFYPDPADPRELADALGLTPQWRKPFGELSGGQQQRLSIALALVGNPRIAILDELTTGLDPQARRDTWELIREVRDRGVTVILVTHLMDEAEQLCDRLVIIDRGRVVASGRPTELVGAPDQHFFLRLPPGSDIEVMTDLLRLPEVGSIVAARGGGYRIAGGLAALAATAQVLAERNVTPVELWTWRRTLEDVFLDVTGADPMMEAAA